jgi:hypothetical protein
LREIAATGEEQRKTLAAKPIATAPQRAAALRQGVDPETGLRLPVAARSEITKNLNMIRTPKLKQEQKSAAVEQVASIVQERWSSDKSPEQMVSRIRNEKHPLFGNDKSHARYLITGKNIYDRKWINGKMQFVLNVPNFDEATSLAQDQASRWFTANP